MITDCCLIVLIIIIIFTCCKCRDHFCNTADNTATTGAVNNDKYQNEIDELQIDTNESVESKDLVEQFSAPTRDILTKRSIKHADHYKNKPIGNFKDDSYSYNNKKNKMFVSASPVNLVYKY